MNKNLHKIDDNFRDAFDNFQPEPPAMVWENIEMNIQEKKKRRSLFLPFLALAFVLGGLSSYLFFARNISIVSANVSVDECEKIIENQSEIAKNNFNFSNENKNIVSKNDVKSSTFFINKNRKSNLFPSKNKTQNADNQYIENINSEKSIVIIDKEIANFTVKYDDENIVLLPTLSPKLLEKDIKLKFGPETECYSFGGKPLKLKNEIEVFGGYEYAFRNLKNNTSETNNYSQVRDSSERFVVAYSGGIRHNIVGKNGFGLRFGISASHLIERFDFVDAQTTFIVKPTDPNLPATTVRGKMTSQTFNRLTTIDIPVQFGFQTLNERSNWNFGVYAGVLVNLNFKTSGKMLNPQGKTIIFNDPTVVFTPKTGLSLIGNFSIKRKINEHFTLNIEPNMLYHFKPLTVSDYALQQKYLKAGLQLGIIYGF